LEVPVFEVPVFGAGVMGILVPALCFVRHAPSTVRRGFGMRTHARPTWEIGRRGLVLDR
jgi:hypothetical protein